MLSGLLVASKLAQHCHLIKSQKGSRNEFVEALLSHDCCWNVFQPRLRIHISRNTEDDNDFPGTLTAKIITFQIVLAAVGCLIATEFRISIIDFLINFKLVFAFVYPVF